MASITGIGVGQGIAIGPVARMSEALPEPVDTPAVHSAEHEGSRATASLAAVAVDLAERGARAGGAAKDVLEAQALMAQDPSLAVDVVARLASGKTAERAVFEAFAGYRDQLVALGGYMAERATDLSDVAQRVIADLQGLPAPGVPRPGHPFVLVARDLAPADAALLDPDDVLALVMAESGPTSHTAILAREKSIVAVVGADSSSALVDGETVIVDAANGTVVTGATDAELADGRRQIAARAHMATTPAGQGLLADGTAIPLLANLGSVDGSAEALAAGAEGVGLFRTEFLYLAAETAPSVELQIKQYTRLLSAFSGSTVVVRVLDAGADKSLPFLPTTHEDNPALGLRGIRALRRNETILRDQLTALAVADAATDADLRVMAPMVATVEEARYFTDLAHSLGIRSAGVMVEVPAAALLADRMMSVTDFASVGTNDLTQYALAADRLLGSVGGLQDPWHPAVLRLIAEVGTAGRLQSKPVGICGEAAADPSLAVVLVGLGATSLSMSVPALADVRASLARFTLDEARELAAIALAADAAHSAKADVLTRIAEFSTT